MNFINLLPSLLSLLGRAGSNTQLQGVEKLIGDLVHAVGALSPDKKEEEVEPIDILWAQTLLKKLGFDPGPLDGKYGPRTAGAVRAYQSARGLEADGLLGQITKAALLKETIT